jgi:peptidoglycan L-alanyl-D-glutamate endopeptidase CwlK
MTYNLSLRSKQRLSGVNPILVAVVERAIEITESDFFVGEGIRSVERQRQLVNQGFSRTMNSKHIIGDAVDIHPHPYKGDHDNDGVPNSDDFDAYKPIVDAMRVAAKELGVSLTHGFDWGWDAPHHEIATKKKK